LLAAHEESKNAKTINAKKKTNNFFTTIFLRDELIQLFKGRVVTRLIEKRNENNTRILFLDRRA